MKYNDITKEYILELAQLYGIEVYETSQNHMVEDVDGTIRPLLDSDYDDVFGFKNEENIDWINLDNCYMDEFKNSKVSGNTLKVKLFNDEDTKRFNSEQLKGVA